MTGDANRASFIVAEAEAGLRLDQALAARVPGLSRRGARLLLDIGGVLVHGGGIKVAARLVRGGKKISANLGGAIERATPHLGREARDSDEAPLPPYAIVHE